MSWRVQITQKNHQFPVYWTRGLKGASWNRAILRQEKVVSEQLQITIVGRGIGGLTLRSPCGRVE
jgi:hypothetical protein